jgi:hypothetical protein
MSQWGQWFRGFVKGWFAGVAKGLSMLEENIRSNVLRDVISIEPTSSVLSSFNEAWKDFPGESEVTSQVHESLDMISDLDDGTRAYLNKWMESFLESLKKAGGTTITDVLQFSGQMCAEAHVQNLFIELWKEHGELEPFASALNERMGQGHNLFRVIDKNTIEVTYPLCFCPLVNFGLIKVPILCNCSSFWLKSNFEVVLEKEVAVSRQGTVLAGSEKCSFIVQF